MFDTIAIASPDALLANAAAVRADPRGDKLDLGVGIYQDDSGGTPVFPAVKAAERHLAETQESKAYLPPRGNAAFLSALGDHVLGKAPSRADAARRRAVQTPGGTGALRVAFGLVGRLTPGAQIWCGMPSWPGYAAVVESAGLRLRTFPYLSAGGEVDMASLRGAIMRAGRGDAMLLQACCHNPTGIDMTAGQWTEIATLLDERGVIPVIDVAYQGFGIDPDEDARGLRLALLHAREVLVAVTCSKSFGLYRERTGALFVQGAKPSAMDRIALALDAIARGLWTTPPDHGAAVVAHILGNPALRQEWLATIAAMRQRVNMLRADLAARMPDGDDTLGRGRGLFTLLAIEAPAIAELRTRHAIHVPASGRINLAGLGTDSTRFVAALAAARGALL